jgi:hypothetical protein
MTPLAKELAFQHLFGRASLFRVFKRQSIDTLSFQSLLLCEVGWQISGHLKLA